MNKLSPFLDNTKTNVYFYGHRNPYSPYHYIARGEHIREVTDDERYMYWLYAHRPIVLPCFMGKLGVK